MSLLREIQNAAIDSNVDLSSLLRKCKVLAARLGNKEFKTWVEYELSGYPDDKDLPDYRIFHVNSKGNFAGAFGRMIKNADIMMHVIPKEYRKHLEYHRDIAPVAELESLVKGSDGPFAQVPWSSSVAVHLGRGMYSGMECLQAWKVIPITKIEGMLDTIRTKILNFALEIESENPDVGEAPMNSNPVPQEKVQNVFNTYITGNVQNVATGSHHFTQNTSYNTELFDSLLDALQKLNGSSAAEDMVAIVEEMRADNDSTSFKAHYQKFISLLADHMQVLGPVVTPFLPAITSLIS
ncbi:AbiTii domain-containing protein [Citrobacter koseri]|uniref:AbiTii domain-containing protein n=1 Tax=Citrobacter koseri TaxID=545 RepID=UPI0038915663